MPFPPNMKRIKLLTFLITPLLTLVSVCGIVIPATYSRETPSLIAQGIAQDAFDLFVVVPALLLSTVGLTRKWRSASHLWGGLMLYVVYSFVIYAFSLFFNYLFLGYCAVLGLSFYAALVFYGSLNADEFKSAYSSHANVAVLGGFLLAIAILFGLLWLSQILPALLQGSIPPSITEQGLRTNPVYVLDLSFLLPGMIITAIALLRRKAIGYVFGPAFAVFSGAMALSLAVMMLVMKQQGLAEDIGMTVGFSLLAIVSVGVFVAFERSGIEA